MHLDDFDRAIVEAAIIKDPRRAKTMKALGLTLDEIGAVLLGHTSLEAVLEGLNEGPNDDTKSEEKPDKETAKRKKSVQLRDGMTTSDAAIKIIDSASKNMTIDDVLEEMNASFVEDGEVSRGTVNNVLRVHAEEGAIKQVSKRPAMYAKRDSN